MEWKLSGYTPVFSSIYDGTLYGKWPAAAVFATLLPLADVRGHIDMSPEAIAGRTGWPLELLLQGIEQLCEPDRKSRSQELEGRRLVPLDPGRSWGWSIVNHELYREKARLMAKNAREIEDGKNAARMKDRRRPPETAADPLSNSYSNPVLKKATSVADRREEARNLWPRVLAAISNADLQKSFPIGGDVQRTICAIGGWRALGLKNRDLRGQTEQAFLNSYAELSAG